MNKGERSKPSGLLTGSSCITRDCSPGYPGALAVMSDHKIAALGPGCGGVPRSAIGGLLPGVPRVIRYWIERGWGVLAGVRDAGPAAL